MTALEQSPAPRAQAAGTDGSHFQASLIHAAARMYYEQDATQAEVAAKLRTSRATVSRLLSEARRRGIVRIEVVAPDYQRHDELAVRLAAALELSKVHISADLPAPAASKSVRNSIGSVLAPAVGQALSGVGLVPGDVLLVASGRTIYEVSRFELPPLPGVVVAPTIGGTDQPEGWYQTNEITRRIAERIGGRPTYLFAPAMPGAELFETLQNDPAIQRVLQLWPVARCLLTGVGAPPVLRREAPHFVDISGLALVEAVGDVCSRFFDRAGEPVTFPGSERLLALDLQTLIQIPVVIAVAAGQDKVLPIITGARAHYFNQLVTDPQTAELIVARA
jgi:DNA-binding transcriptional regulator LsrR (DeoR family)